MASLWNTLNKIDPNYFPNGPDFLIPYENFMAKPKVQILYHDIDRVDSQVSSKSGNLAIHSSPLSIIVYLQISFYGPMVRNHVSKSSRHFTTDRFSDSIKWHVTILFISLPFPL